MRRLLITALCTVVLGFVGGGTAFGHSGTESAAPGPGDKVPAGVESVRLVFDSLASSGSHRVHVLDSQDDDWVTGDPEVVDNQVTATTEPLDPGVYKVEYAVVSGDGHTSSSAYFFEVTPNPNHDSGIDATTIATISTAGVVVLLTPALVLRRRHRK